MHTHRATQTHTQTTFRGKVIPQCYTHPLGQAARQASPSKWHCFLSVAAEITCFQLRNPLVSLSSITPPRLPSLIVILPPPLCIFATKDNEHGVFLHGVRLCSTSGHWHWQSNSRKDVFLRTCVNEEVEFMERMSKRRLFQTQGPVKDLSKIFITRKTKNCVS